MFFRSGILARQVRVKRPWSGSSTMVSITPLVSVRSPCLGKKTMGTSTRGNQKPVWPAGVRFSRNISSPPAG